MNNLTKLIAAILLAAGYSAVIRAEETPDTITVLDRVENVTVKRTGNLTELKAIISDGAEDEVFTYRIEVKGEKGTRDDEYPDGWGIDVAFLKFPRIDDNPESINVDDNSLRRSVLFCQGVFGGWRFNYNDKAHVKNCYELGFRNLLGLSWSRGKYCPSFSIGLGLKFARYLSQDGYFFGKQKDRLVSLPAGNVEVRHSTLDVFTWMVPLTMTQRIGRECAFSIGGVVGFNSYAKAMVETRDGDTRHKISYKGLQQNLINAEVFASFGWDMIGVYASWAPMKLFDAQYGPELKGWSLGVTLFY